MTPLLTSQDVIYEKSTNRMKHSMSGEIGLMPLLHKESSLSESVISEHSSLPVLNTNTSLALQEVTAIDQGLINFASMLQDVTTAKVRTNKSQEVTQHRSLNDPNLSSYLQNPLVLQDVTLDEQENALPLESTVRNEVSSEVNLMTCANISSSQDATTESENKQISSPIGSTL